MTPHRVPQTPSDSKINDGPRDITLSAWPKLRARARDEALERRIEAILASLSLEQRIGQLIQADIGSVTPDDVREFQLGSVLNGGNSAPGGNLRARPSEWLALADAFWDASMHEGGARVPIIWGSDAIHGNSNVAGATIFPHAINLGATRDAELVRRIGAATALEMAVTGMDWTFAPTLAVVQDVRWGRTYEAFSSDPQLVAELGVALIRGLQGGEPGAPEFLGPASIAATTKHFVGDGGTHDGRDQGETVGDEATLRAIHAVGYGPAIEAGVQSIMASFSSWGGQHMHGRRDLLTGLLKQHWDFDGPVVGDWNGHGQLPGATSENCPDALIAGLDLYMAPDSWRGLYRNTLAQARDGVIPRARIDDAVRRVLRLKLRVGLFDKPKPSQRPFAGRYELLSCPDHIALATEGSRKSAVLLKNADKLLPLKPTQNVLIAGAAAHRLNCQTGGWTLSWQGQELERGDFPASETLAEGVARVVTSAGGSVQYAPDGDWSTRPDIAIVAIGEEPYAEFRGDLEALDYKPGDSRDYDLIRKLRADGLPVVVVFFSGRPLWVNPALNAANAFIAAFLPGGQAGALADMLFRSKQRFDFTGALPFGWPRHADQYDLNQPDVLFPRGFKGSLADTLNIAELHERGVASGADPHIVFDLGAAQGGWKLTLEDSGGASEIRAPAFHSPREAVRARAFNLNRQEGALALSWSKDEGALFLRHPAVDLSRDANADCCLALQYQTAAPGALRLRLHGADGASQALELPLAEGLATIEFPLKAYGLSARALTEIVAISLEAPGPLDLVLIKLSIAARVPGA
ncbi:MAG: glycoside hydrolase family 3 N-terminal domain-containing protein [Hyphomonadaceae bacterium]|nr:glycoside hydrolase family 3 N-terminal domain-containing protein [Hyphomonadaceae bacterium]